jgi:partner of Y14 and mago protein
MAPSTPVSSSGITVNAVTGERHIPSSMRADGTTRREIRVRPGYLPPEDVEVYKNRTAAAWRNRGAGGIPGAEGLNDDVHGGINARTATSNKNAKKREAKKRAKVAVNDNSATGETDITVSTSADISGILGQENWRSNASPPAPSPDHFETVVDLELEKERKARNLRKKLRQARELREKKDKGEDLLPEQFEKVIKIQELIRQLDALGFDAEGQKKENETGDSV